MTDINRKKITISELKKYLPIASPPFPQKLPQRTHRFLTSQTFSNMSLGQQNTIRHKYETVYRNYYGVDQLVKYIDLITQSKYTHSSIKRMLMNVSQKYGVIDWYKFMRKVMSNTIEQVKNNATTSSSNDNKIVLVNKIKDIFKKYREKKKIWKGVSEIADTKKSIQPKVLNQLCQQVFKQMKQFVDRDRQRCQRILFKCQQQYPKHINFITLQKIINRDLQVIMDRKKVMYLYLYFDLANRGYFKTFDLVSQLLSVKKIKVVKKQTYYLTDLEELMERIRAEMSILFYSEHEMQQDFDQYYVQNLHKKGLEHSEQQEIDQELFYKYISLKCQDRYSRYMINKLHKKIKFRQNIHYLFNKPNMKQLTKLVLTMTNKKNKKRILKKQNQVFYSFRYIILVLISKCKSSKLTKEKLGELMLQNSQNQQKQLKYKAFYCVWRVYPGIINIDRIKKDCNLSQLACYLKLRRTQQEYDKMYDYLLQLMPQDTKITYEKFQQKINLNLDFILDITKIKPLKLDRYDQVDYRQSIKKVFQPDFQLDIRHYIHKKVSQKTYALWKAYLARKQVKMRMQKLAQMVASSFIPSQKVPTESSKKLKTSKSKTSLKSKKQIPVYNVQSLQIAQYNLKRILEELPIRQIQTKKHFNKQIHSRNYLSVNKRQNYEYRTLTPRYALHPIPGMIGMGAQLMFLNKNKQQILKIKFLHKPGIQVIDFITLGNDVVLLTSYFTLQFYNLAQQSNYSFHTMQLLEQVKNINFSVIDSICEDRMYSKFPIFIRSNQNNIIVNASIPSNCVLIVDVARNEVSKSIKFSQRQHIISKSTSKILKIIKQSSRKSQLYTQILVQFSKQQINAQNIKQIVMKELQQMQNEGKNKIIINQPDIKQFVRNLQNYSPPFLNYIMKQQLDLTQKQKKFPQILTQILTALISYMKVNNLSLQQILNQIDKQGEGYIKIKDLKDYLLKITQHVYLEHQKQIDNVIKNMAVGKNIQYQIFCQLMISAGWKLKVWEKSYLIIRDFIFVADSSILIYTIQGHNIVYIKNIQDDQVIAHISGHNTAPSIHFIQQSYMLVTGDSGTIRMWRLYEDMIKKYQQNPPWEISPYSVISNAHDSMITSILYLSRAHHLVTTGLDSTAKFWKINSDFLTRKQLYLEQIKRFYSNQCVYINSKGSNILLSQQGCRLQIVALAKISKQVNENNKYKYQMKIQVFQVQNMMLKTGASNIYLQIPPKLKKVLEDYVDSLGVKKNILLAKSIKNYQQQTMKNNLISTNLQRTLYESVKNCFIFDQFTQLSSLCQYLQKKNITSQIVIVLFQKFGVGIPKSNPKAITYLNKNNGLKPQQAQIQSENMIQISQQELQNIMKDINNKKNDGLSLDEVLGIAGNFLNVYNFQKLQNLLTNYTTCNPNAKYIDKKFIQSIFKPIQYNSQLDKLYATLRSVNVVLKKKGLKIWNIFTNNKAELEKKRKVSQTQFQKYIMNLGFTEKKVKFLISYLSRDKSITLADYVYYTKMAWQVVGYDMSQSNFSKVFMKNSQFLRSKFQLMKLDSDIQVQAAQFQQKTKNLQDSVQVSNSRSSLSPSRKSSKRKLRQEEDRISQSHSGAQNSQSSLQKKSLRKSQSPFGKDDNPAHSSNPMSSSNSRVSLSNQAGKDQKTKQAQSIAKKIYQMLKNQNKTIWQIVSLTIPQFMQNHLITESQFFSILSVIRSPIYLSDKLKLMTYIMRESNEYSAIDLNIFFQIFATVLHSQQKSLKKNEHFVIAGQKYIISHFLSRISQSSFILEHSLSQYLFNEKDELTIDQILTILADKPFNMLLYSLKQFQLLLINQNKSSFNIQDFKSMIQQRIDKYNLKIQSKQVNFIEEIIHQIDKRGAKLQQLLPKSMTINNLVVNYQSFQNMVNSFFHQKPAILQNQFIKVVLQIQQDKKKLQIQKNVESPSKFNKLKNSAKKLVKQISKKNHQQMLKKSQIKYKQLINYITKMVQKIKSSSNTEKDSVKKFLKALQNKRINLLIFFVSLDRNRNYYINQIQFLTGLGQLKISENFWLSIKKRNPKKLYYNQLINYLVQNQLVNYKCVDSELSAAIIKFNRKFLRNDDIQVVFDRIKAKQSNTPYNCTFSSFQTALKTGNQFNNQQINIIFAAFANADILKSGNLSNDSIIKDPTNVYKSFNFKMFTDVISMYSNENITKTPQYKLCSFFKKRNISILNEFTKWMQRNKKNKQISQAIKNKQFTLSRQLYANFIKQLGPQLQQKQIKQMMTSYPNPLQFSQFTQKLQQIYKKGNSNMESQQISAYLHKIYKKIKNLNVAVSRLFKDFSTNQFKMDSSQFNELIKFLQLGLTKIQIKMIFTFIDSEKKNYITVSQLQNALQEASQTLQKQQDQYQLDFIVQKLIANKDKYVLKPSRIPFNLDRAILILSNILTQQQIILLYKSAQQHFKNNEISQKSMDQFIIDKQKQAKAKKDKKYKQLILNFLRFLKKANLEVSEAYYYFSKDNGVLTKNKFLLCYQSINLKSTIAQINALYAYLDEAKFGNISLQKWEQKLNIVQYEKQNIEQGISGQQLQVFYKVKLIMTDIYLIFVRKLFRSKQIYAYFDINGTGSISHLQFFESINKLGMHLQQSIESKLINYLDKQRSGNIPIKNLVYQLETCIGSKNKLILQTKTSCIFKQKIHLIQEKQNYFIQKLVKLENFLDHNGKVQSCILVTDFVDAIKDFGIVLADDQFSDVQRNFKFNKDNLLLYPLYFMFVNIFKSYENTLSKDQMQRLRFQRLFNQVIKNNLTMKVFEKMQTIKQASIFLSQLKIFTPIEVKLMIQCVALSGTNLIDTDLLISKTRDSFLAGNQFQSSSMQFGTQRKQNLNNWLKMQIDPKKVLQILKANRGKIDKQTFQNMLIKMNIVLKKNQVSQLFNIASNGQDYILIQSLLQQKNNLTNQEQGQARQSQYSDLLLNHICKSLDFKGACLEEGWQKYFTNFGFITFQNFYQFLEQIGFDYKQKQNEKIVPQFLQVYKKQTKLYQLKVSQFEQIMKRYNQIPQKLSKNQRYLIISNSIDLLTQLLNNSSNFYQGMQQYLHKQGINPNNVPFEIIYCYLRLFFKNSFPKFHHLQKQLIFFVNLILKKNEISLQQFKNQLKYFLKQYNQKQKITIKTQQDEAILVNDPSTTSLQKSIKNKRFEIAGHLNTLNKICQQNFIESYKILVNAFQQQIGKLSIPSQNSYRLILNLVIQNLLQNDYLLLLKPKLHSNLLTDNSKADHKIKRNVYLQHGQKLNMKTVANLLIEKQQFLQQKSIYLINDKYHAMNVSEKKDFQSFAIATNLLDNQITFIRSKNYYLWEPIQSHLSKPSINFRWKYIPICLLKIAKQISTLQDYGYALPHLRWDNLHSERGISRVLFPAHADATGKIQHILHQNLLKAQDAYCAPQLFRKKSGITLKLNTWVLGCIIYQFIWGHSPNSFNQLLLQYIVSRHADYDLQQVLKMDQLPSDFRYSPLNFLKIKKVLAFEHQLKAQGIPDDLENNIIYFGFRGLIKNLQTMYGKQSMYFKKQFEIFQKLHEIVIQCLDLNPETRPDVKQIVQRLSGLMEQQDYKDFNFGEYVQVLNNHKPIQILNQILIDPLKINLMKQQKNADQADKISQNLYKALSQIKNAQIKQTIKDIYTIPKKYPWPDKQQTDSPAYSNYQRHILDNKAIIRTHPRYSSICLIQNQNCLQMLMNLYVKLKRQKTTDTKIINNIFQNILKSLVLIFQMLHTYSNPFSGYVQSLLQIFIQLYYEQPFSFNSSFQGQQKSRETTNLITLQHHTVQQQKLLNLIKNIVYYDGSANIQYLPIHHFLFQYKQYQNLFQYFYSTIELIDNHSAKKKQENANSGIDKKIRTIDYFRDRIYDENFWQIVQYLRIDILIMRLIDNKQLVQRVLLFFRDFTTYKSCIDFPLMKSNIFYLKLGDALSSRLVSVQIKQLVIQIATNILRINDSKIIKRLYEPAFNIIKQIFKLLVQPVKDTPAHQEYMHMIPVLNQFACCIKTGIISTKIQSQIQGSQTIIAAFLQMRKKQQQQLSQSINL